METALYPRLVGRVRFRAASRRPGSHNRSIRDATRLYLRAAKEAHEFTVNVLSEKFRRASRLMNHANTTDPSSMIRRIMTRDARKQLDRYFDAIEYAIDHHI